MKRDELKELPEEMIELLNHFLNHDAEQFSSQRIIELLGFIKKSGMMGQEACGILTELIGGNIEDTETITNFLSAGFQSAISGIAKVKESIAETGYLDNHVTILKNFKTIHVQGKTPEDFINDLRVFFDAFYDDDFHIPADHVNHLLSMETEEIMAVAKRHKAVFRHGNTQLQLLLDQFKNEGNVVNARFFELVLFLIDICEKVTKEPLLSFPAFEVIMNYYNAKEILNNAEQSIAKDKESGNIARHFFELGRAFQALNPNKYSADARVNQVLVGRRAAEIRNMRQDKNNKGEIVDEALFKYAQPAWNAGCKLLHKQMAITIYDGILNYNLDLEKIEEELKRVAPSNFIQGTHGARRTVDVCPCEIWEKCSIGEALHDKKIAYDLSGTHTKKTERNIRMIKYKNPQEVKNALLKRK